MLPTLMDTAAAPARLDVKSSLSPVRDIVVTTTTAAAAAPALSSDREAAHRDGRGKVLYGWSQRGTRKAPPGSCYYDQEDVQQRVSASPAPTPIGVAYSISALSNVDVALETFDIVLNLNFRYEIHDQDVAQYEKEYKKEVQLKDLADNPNIKVKPPVLEVMNSQSYEFKMWRIIAIDRCLNHRKQWQWHVTFCCQLQAKCSEEFELQQFPFTRQALQVHIQAKQALTQLFFVPFQEPSVQPKWRYCKEKQEVEAVPMRLNFMNCSEELGTWDAKGHHIAFPPEDHLMPLPSGNKYSRCIITIQCQQSAGFFIWNTVPIIICLPILSALAVLEPTDAVADRSSVVFALLLTMATYKVSITSWMPKKSYLTYLDKYVLTGFMFILLIGALVGVSALVQKLNGGVVEAFEQFEQYTSLVLIGLWLLIHLLALMKHGSIYPSWKTVMQEEGSKLLALKDKLEESAKLQWELTALANEEPKPAPPGATDAEVQQRDIIVLANEEAKPALPRCLGQRGATDAEKRVQI